MRLYDIKTLQKYEKQGWIRSHQLGNLIIWNYTNQTQYGQYWDGVTMNCRGLVTDLNGFLVSKGFSKFFNFSEGKIDINKYPKDFKVKKYPKLDGSYIGLFFHEEWRVMSKGSFSSDQVFLAKGILSRYDLDKLDKSLTYCFELIHPQNRIVVDYGQTEDLFLLACFRDGVEVEHECQFKRVPEEEIVFNYEEIQSRNIPNEEGYVIKFPDGQRCKIKFDEYLRLHRIVTNTTSYDIWECLKNGDDFDCILDRVPDEFYDWVKDVKSDLLAKYEELFDRIIKRYHVINESLGQCSDKEFALLVKDNKYSHYLFGLRNGRNISESIWKSIKPKFEKAFQK